MFSLIQKWCAYVFPERADHKLVRDASTADVLGLLNPSQFTDFISLMDFKEPLVRALVHEAKFQGNEKAWDLLALALAQYLKHQPGGTRAIPVPLSPRRQRARKYNQVQEVVKRALKQASHIKLEAGILYRTRDTVPQTTLIRTERLKNVEGAFVARGNDSLKGACLIIIDDVATTGSTLKAARAALIGKNPDSITLLAFAH